MFFIVCFSFILQTRVLHIAALQTWPVWLRGVTEPNATVIKAIRRGPAGRFQRSHTNVSEVIGEQVAYINCLPLCPLVNLCLYRAQQHGCTLLPQFPLLPGLGGHSDMKNHLLS